MKLFKKRKKRSKHDMVTDNLEQRLRKSNNVRKIYRNVNYLLGECDILAQYYDGKFVYYEVKSTHSKRNMNKAQDQLIRWIDYMKFHYPERTYYGVYHSPKRTKIMGSYWKRKNDKR